jgi:perosamine synthetase
MQTLFYSNSFAAVLYMKMFGYKEGVFPITEDVTGRTIALPFFNNLKEEQIGYVMEKLKKGIGRNSR